MKETMDSNLIILPQLFLGGAEKQFRMLFEHLGSKSIYILALGKSRNKEALLFKDKYRKRVFECTSFCRQSRFVKIMNLIILPIPLLYFRSKGVKRIVIIEAYLLVLIPIMKLFGFKILYSERNNGKHKWNFIYYLISKCDYVNSNSIDAKIFLSSKIRKVIEVINNGVLLPSNSNFQVKERDRIFKVLVPARIDFRKNQKIVIKALKNVDNIEVHFAGTITFQDYYKEMLALIGQESNKFIFDGHIDNMIEHYKKFDIIILPSLEEGTSNVILECFANGIPCMVSNIPMNVRICKNERYIFETDNCVSLKDKIMEFRKTPISTIQKDIIENYNFVYDNFSIQKMVNSYMEVLV